MQVTQSRSSVKKNGRSGRESYEIKQKSNNFLLASKMGDFSQRNPTSYSKELALRKQKAGNTEYIRNLYKKYVGKQNNLDRKTRTDAKYNKNHNIVYDQQIQRMNYEPQLTKIQSSMDRLSDKKSLMIQERIGDAKQIKAVQKMSKYRGGQLFNTQYSSRFDNQMLYILGDRRNTIILAMQTINNIKQKRMNQ